VNRLESARKNNHVFSRMEFSSLLEHSPFFDFTRYDGYLKLVVVVIGDGALGTHFYLGVIVYLVFGALLQRVHSFLQ